MEQGSEDLFQRGVDAAIAGRHDEALALFDKALEVNPRSAEAWNNKAFVPASLNRNDEALSCCDRAIEIDPGYPDPWDIKGRVLGRLGRYDEAKTAIKRFIEIAPPGYQERVDQAKQVLSRLEPMGLFKNTVVVAERPHPEQPRQAQPLFGGDTELAAYMIKAEGTNHLSLHLMMGPSVFIFGWLIIIVYSLLGIIMLGIWIVAWVDASRTLSRCRESARRCLAQIDSDPDPGVNLKLELGILLYKAFGEKYNGLEALKKALDLPGGDATLWAVAGILLNKSGDYPGATGLSTARRRFQGTSRSRSEPQGRGPKGWLRELRAGLSTKPVGANNMFRAAIARRCWAAKAGGGGNSNLPKERDLSTGPDTNRRVAS